MPFSNKLTKACLVTAIGACLVAGMCLLCGCVQVNVSPSSTNTSSNAANTVPGKSVHELAGITYTFSPAEVGDTTTYTLTRNPDGTVTLSLAEFKGVQHSEPEEFEISGNAMDEIEKICTRYGIFDWPEKVPDNDIFYADAAESTFTLNKTDGSTIFFSTLDKLPDNGKEATSELSRYIESLIDID